MCIRDSTPGGGQLADLTNKVLYSGDTLGAQVHLGGGTVMMSKIDSWLNGALKSATVSYTHLKQSRWVSNRNSNDEWIYVDLEAVSYTHLDVYKRQNIMS